MALLMASAPEQSRIFRIELHAGVWLVTKDRAFYGEYLSRASAFAGACAAARAVEALGGTAQVLAGRAATVVPHHGHIPRT